MIVAMMVGFVVLSGLLAYGLSSARDARIVAASRRE
jgi:hypothetical protein